MTVKSTYALDLETVRALERVAQRWRVSKSEALRRAIRAAAGEDDDRGHGELAALDELQRAVSLSPVAARAWERRAAGERRSASRRAEVRGR